MDHESLRSLLEFTQDKIVVVDAEGTYKYANAAVERILGFDREDFVGTNTFEYIHEADRPRVQATFEQLVEADEDLTETVTYRHRTAEGSWVWLESRMWNQANSTLGGYVVSSRDVSDRKVAEQNQAETEARLRQIARNTDDVLWMFSADFEELLFINDAYEEIWGMPVAELAGEPIKFLDGVHPNDRPRVHRAMNRLSAGEQIDLEYRVNDTLAYRRWVWVRGQAIVEQGEVTKIVGFARDITDRRRRERQLKVLDNLLRHNLRNTMNIIFGHADLTRERADADIAGSMDAIEKAGRKLFDTVEKERQIVDVLIDINEPVSIELAPLIADVLGDIRSRHPDAMISADIPEEVSTLAIPALGDAVAELLENAIEHAESDPEIELQVGLSPETVTIQIRDNAPRIPGNEIEPLFAETDPSAVYHGTGLGLWLVYWVVDICNGTLGFGRRTDDTGNVVTIRLPRVS